MNNKFFEIDHWIDHTNNIQSGCLFFFIRPKTIRDDKIDERIKNIIKKLPTNINFYLCPVDLSHYQYPENIIVLKTINYNEYEHLVQEKYYKVPQKVIGITGTSGKTSTVNLLKTIYENNGIKSVYVGTTGCSIKINNYDSNIPMSYLAFHELLHKSVEDNVEIVILECSSYGIQQGRINNIEFDAVVFTSFSEDHIDFHKSLLDYFLTKVSLINYLKKNGVVFINHNIKLMASFLNLINHPVFLIENLWDFTNFHNEDYNVNFFDNIKKIPIEIHKNIVKIQDKWEFNFEKKDIFQINNLTMAAIIFWLLENKIPVVKNSEIHGRFNEFTKKDITIFIDYCHSLEKVKYFINMLKKYLLLNNFNKKIVIVVGIASKEIETRFKRLIWLANNVDYIILTNDNMFNDFNPQKYIDIMTTYPNVTYIADRQEGITHAIENYANENYIIGCIGIGESINLQINNQIIEYNEYSFIKKYLDNL